MLKKYEIESLQKYFDAANYISACQLYLLDNPLLKRKLEMSDIKKKYTTDQDSSIMFKIKNDKLKIKTCSS